MGLVAALAALVVLAMTALAVFRQSSFAPAFFLLSTRRRKALAAVYAFARAVDDAVDEPGGEDPKAVLDRWRRLLSAPYVDGRDSLAAPPAWKPLEESLAVFPIDRRHLLGLIDGVARDLGGYRAETAEDFKTYCFGVASTVGLACMAIFGLDESSHRDFAVNMGLAVQTVNILRDVKTDAEENRVYLPQEDLRRFGVQEEDLRSTPLKSSVLRLLRFEAARARAFFIAARKALPPLSRRAARPALLMGTLYEKILDKLEREDYFWGRPQPRLSWREKAGAFLACLIG